MYLQSFAPIDIYQSSQEDVTCFLIKINKANKVFDFFSVFSNFAH